MKYLAVCPEGVSAGELAEFLERIQQREAFAAGMLFVLEQMGRASRGSERELQAALTRIRRVLEALEQGQPVRLEMEEASGVEVPRWLA